MWKNGKKWVYSISYDEGCELLLQHALDVHRRFDVPGHIALVAGQIGVPRKVPGSSYDGMMILSKDQINMLCREGWGVSCHGMNHISINNDNVKVEVYESRKLLEDTLEMPVTMFCLPGNNDHLSIVRDHAAQAGYTSILTIHDDINTPDSDLLRLCRVPLHSEYPPPFCSAYDPYKRIHQAIDAGGWIIDYAHCPMPGKPIHAQKDCTIKELETRFETIRRIGGDDVWIAEPNEVVDYIIHKKENEK
ncbi:MAG: polysaccharide deacetylase family protein [Phycisphaerae bacterium]|nr:polysaccharide deacetylase family protein [Phycisphaerae bacterium]